MKNGPIWRRKKCSFTKTGRITLRIAASSTLFSRFGPMRFPFVPKHEKFSCGKRFTSNEEVIAATEAYFVEFGKPYFLDGLKKLEYRWTK